MVGTQTIENTLSSSGQISTNLTENLELNTYRYFKEIYVEENDFVAEWENILKYTNGTYLTAPYTFQNSVDVMLISFCSSAAIGLIFGIFPAYRAAGLNPIDALRTD